MPQALETADLLPSEGYHRRSMPLPDLDVGDFGYAAGLFRNVPGIGPQRVHAMLAKLAGLQLSPADLAWSEPSPTQLRQAAQLLRDRSRRMLHGAIVDQVADWLEKRALGLH